MSLSGEKPFKCDTCNKQFAHHSDLIRHHTVHSGECHTSSCCCPPLLPLFALNTGRWFVFSFSCSSQNWSSPPTISLHLPLSPPTLVSVTPSHPRESKVRSHCNWLREYQLFYPGTSFTNSSFIASQRNQPQGVWSAPGHVIYYFGWFKPHAARVTCNV